MSVFFLYLPFGETMAQQNAAGWETPYKFTGKVVDTDRSVSKIDAETGLYYFGARYYDPRLSYFWGMDPMAEKYPGFSSYIYCANNPNNIIDVDGREIINAYETQRNAAKSKLSEAQNKLASITNIDKSAYREAKRELKRARRDFNTINETYSRVQSKINDVKEKRLDIYEKANNLTDAGGNQVDVYVFNESHVKMQEGNPFSRDGKEVFGLTQAIPDIYVVNTEGVGYYKITSKRSPGNASIIMSDQSNSQQLSHEFGHTIYQTNNMKEYINWLKAHPDQQRKGGHGKNDPSGAAAKEAEKGF